MQVRAKVEHTTAETASPASPFIPAHLHRHCTCQQWSKFSQSSVPPSSITSSRPNAMQWLTTTRTSTPLLCLFLTIVTRKLSTLSFHDELTDPQCNSKCHVTSGHPARSCVTCVSTLTKTSTCWLINTEVT